MRSEVYINLLKESSRKLHLIKMTDEDFELANDLRSLLKRYEKLAMDILYYPKERNQSIDKARNTIKSINEICKESNFNVFYNKLVNDRLSDKIFFKVNYKNVNITQIIKIW